MKIFKVEVIAPDPLTLKYYLGEYNHNFYIDEKSGEVWLSNPHRLDYSIEEKHTLEVNVEDDVQKASNNKRTLTIDIIWINQQPEFSPKEYLARMPEECNQTNGANCNNQLPWNIPGLVLYPLDRDFDNKIPTGSPDVISCNLLPGFGSDMFEFDGTSFCSLIDVTSRIDVDDNPQYMSINLTSHIKDAYGLSNNGKVYITVYDINDNRPKCSPTSYTATIKENTAGGVSLFTVSCTDKDSGINAEIRYSLQQINKTNNKDGTYYFEVDDITGTVSTKHPVDYEQLASGHEYIDFYLVARDQGTPSQSSDYTSIRVHIEDVNDNHPIFDCSDKPGFDEPEDPDYKCFYNLEIKSITFNDTEVLTLAADDADEITPHPKYYKLIPEEHFVLSYMYGNISTDTHQLYTKHKYVIYALSTDEGNPELLSTPSIVRIDTFSMAKYAVDVHVKFDGNCDEFDYKKFILETRKFIQVENNKPWFIKGEGCGYNTDRVVIHIYALRDVSTYLYKNLKYEKYFVPTRYELLKPLRKTILGKPSDEYWNHMDKTGYNVILVMPWEIIWLIDTLPGLITLLLLIVLFITFWIVLAIYCCKKHEKCCFKKKVGQSKQKSGKRRKLSASSVHTLVYDQINYR